MVHGVAGCCGVLPETEHTIARGGGADGATGFHSRLHNVAQQARVPVQEVRVVQGCPSGGRRGGKEEWMHMRDRVRGERVSVVGGG